MISYLRGQVAAIIPGSSNRITLILEVNDIGYEIQIPSRLARQLAEAETSTDSVQVYTHQQIRDEQIVLYGFESAAERDLFRQLVGVTGVGSQLAIALIDTLGLAELVEAIVTGNTRVLSKTPGVGNKTAERIALELKTKLAQWRQALGITTPTAAVPSAELREDVEMTLLAIGYSTQEIEQALSAISQDRQLVKNPHAEEWIRRAIAWLSQ